MLVLEDGAPANENVNKGGYEYFKLFISKPNVDVQVIMNDAPYRADPLHGNHPLYGNHPLTWQVIMTAFSGDPDMFVSTTHARPNASSFEYRSQDRYT